MEGREKPLYLELGILSLRNGASPWFSVLLPEASPTVGLGCCPRLLRAGRDTHLPFLGTRVGRSWEVSPNQ